ncbi:Xaa-Pro_aminopeptidase [Hexamita inflata]|uniref:Xaa-Pro aminopeptidase n=1 Tax=Hexamita inflata TaxID=28002 RepID=A0AA86QI63_9EUKA|nr:Xaa-Pro aminopeptidase [Hexamita inflata]
MTSPTPMLYYSNSSDPNFLHASKFSAPDNMICLVLKDKTLLYASDLEFGRAKQQSSCTVVSLSDYDEQKTIGDKIAKILSENGVTALYVTESFSCKLFEELSKSVQVKVFEGQIGERRAKTASEIENIKLANNASVASYKMIQQILRESTIGENNVLMYQNSVLTCEYLQQKPTFNQMNALLTNNSISIINSILFISNYFYFNSIFQSTSNELANIIWLVNRLLHYIQCCVNPNSCCLVRLCEEELHEQAIQADLVSFYSYFLRVFFVGCGNKSGQQLGECVDRP